MIILIIFFTGVLFYVSMVSLFIAAKLGCASFNISINREKEIKCPDSIQGYVDPSAELLLQSALCIAKHCENTGNCRTCIFWYEESGCGISRPEDWKVEN